MTVSLLSTKLYIPPAQADVVPRPRLIEKLLTGINHPHCLTLLSGPAGSGKTTLLSQFIAQRQQPAAWLSLDEGDNDPIRFWTYLIAACQSALDEIGESALALLQTPQPLPDDAIPTLLVNDMTRQNSELVLVLDDLHVIQNPSVHAGFTFLLDYLPDNLHVMVSTRVDPPWPLAHWRVRRQLVEVRARDLRFTPQEAAVFLNHLMGLALSDETVAALEARTEGWIAGLQLAALSMQGRSDTAAFVQAFTGSHVYVAEYLVEEILHRQSEDVQTFLLQTSVLERLSASLCDAVTEGHESQAVLSSLHRKNLFVLSLDDEGRWFRYHHLFADLLQVRLRQNLPAEAIAALHRRAAAWYEQNGFVAEAVNHALAAKDFEVAARLVVKNAYQVMTRGELTTLMQWIEALPADVVAHHPLIIVAKAWTLALAGAIRQVESLLQQVEAQIEVDDESLEAQELLGNAAAIRAFFAMMAGDYPRALELADRAKAGLPESSVHARWLMPYTQGAAYRGQGQYQKAVEAFTRQAQMGEKHDNLIVWATGITEVAIVQRLQGRLHQAGETCRQALQRMAKRGVAQFGSLAKLEVPLIEVLREQNELAEAHQRATDVLARMQGWPMPTDRIFAYQALLCVQEAQGDLAGALETLRTAQDLKAAHPVLANLARSIDLSAVRLSLKSGDVASAARLLDTLQPGATRTLSSREQELLMLARLRLAQGQPDEAERLLSPLASNAEADERTGALIEILALQACVFHAQGDGERAVTVLIKALALAEPEGFVRTFVDEGEVMQQLLTAVARQPAAIIANETSLPSKGYVARLLHAFEGKSSPDTPPQSPSKEVDLVEPLTARELEVLQLIAAGDSNRAVAEKLVITVSAVKKHTSNIYGKLNVNSRTQAVARARQLNLLPE